MKRALSMATALGRSGVRLAVLAAAALLTVVDFAAAPAYACDCIGYPEQEQFERANVVFTGQVAARKEAGEYELEIIKAFKGSVRKTVTVFGADRSDCGLYVEAGTKCLIFAVDGAGGLSTSKCSAYCDPASIARVLNAVEPLAEKERATHPQRSAVMLAVAAGGVAVAVFGTVAWLRSRRRRMTGPGNSPPSST